VMLPSTARQTLRIRDFELDVEAYQLRRQGRPIRLERQPMELLILLVEHRGRLVSRSDIAERLWGKDVFVDVETGVNIAIRKIRQALCDSAENPAFVETVVGKGYRFVAAVEVVSGGAATGASGTREDRPEGTNVTGSGSAPFGGSVLTSRRSRIRSRMAVGLFTSAVLVALTVWAWFATHATPVKLAVLPFSNLTGNPDRDYLAAGLTEEATVTLAQIASQQVSVVGRQSAMVYKNSSKSLAAIGNELGVRYLVESSIRAEGERLRITSKLIRVRDQVQLWSQSYDRDAGSVLGLQEELSRAIAEQIRLRLSPERIAAVARRQSEKPEAFDLYLRGRHFANQRTPATVARALEYYRRRRSIRTMRSRGPESPMLSLRVLSTAISHPWRCAERRERRPIARYARTRNLPRPRLRLAESTSGSTGTGQLRKSHSGGRSISTRATDALMSCWGTFSRKRADTPTQSRRCAVLVSSTRWTQ
jgi:TolB-like protein/DNA-binding winged helix-turn-helix (wHTH) protein